MLQPSSPYGLRRAKSVKADLWSTAAPYEAHFVLASFARQASKYIKRTFSAWSLACPGAARKGGDGRLHFFCIFKAKTKKYLIIQAPSGACSSLVERQRNGFTSAMQSATSQARIFPKSEDVKKKLRFLSEVVPAAQWREALLVPAQPARAETDGFTFFAFLRQKLKNTLLYKLLQGLVLH